MELRQLQYFVTLANELHFTRAAQRIPISQPQLSSQIKRLETELGVALFNRTKRHVELTHAGLAFVEEVERGLAQLSAAARLATSIGKGEAGTLRIGYVEPAAMEILPGHFRAFTEAVPTASFEAQELPTGEVVRGLQDGRLDIGYIRPMPLSGIESEIVATEEILLVLPASHRLAGDEAIDLASLEADVFIHPSNESGGGWSRRIDDLFRVARIAPRFGSIADRPGTLLALVASGHGYGLLPDSCRRLAGAEVVLRRIAGQVAQIDVAIAWKASEKQPLVKRYIDVVLPAAAEGASDDQLPGERGSTS